MKKSLLSHTTVSRILAFCLIAFIPLTVYLGMFMVFGLVLWLILFTYYCFRKNIPWWNKILVILLAYLHLIFFLGGSWKDFYMYG